MAFAAALLMVNLCVRRNINYYMISRREPIPVEFSGYTWKSYGFGVFWQMKNFLTDSIWLERHSTVMTSPGSILVLPSGTRTAP